MLASDYLCGSARQLFLEGMLESPSIPPPHGGFSLCIPYPSLFFLSAPPPHSKNTNLLAVAIAEFGPRAAVAHRFVYADHLLGDLCISINITITRWGETRS